MRIVDIVYDDYALVHTIKTKEEVSEVLNKLYSKSAISHTTAAGVVCPCGGGGALCVELVDSGLSLSIPFCVCRSHS